MDNNLKKLQWVPFGTPEHDKLVREIQSQNKSRDFVLCMKGMFDQNRSPFNNFNSLAIESQTRGLGNLQNAFEGDENIFSSSKYYFVRRDKAEYNLHHRQVNVGLLITDMNDNVLVLKKRNGFLSLVGGHTDFVREAYTMTVRDLCHHNIKKEFNEEVRSRSMEDIVIPEEPFLFVTEGNEMWDYFHCWFLYHVEVEDLYEFNFKSNEKDKHDTHIIHIDDILSNPEGFKIKNSLTQAIRTLDTYKDRLRKSTPIKVSKPVKRPTLNHHFSYEEMQEFNKQNSVIVKDDVTNEA